MRSPIRFSLSIAIVGLAATVSGCASGPPFRPVSPMPTDRAVVYVYRPSRMLGAFFPIGVSLDGREDLNIFSGDYVSLRVRPGQHYLAPSGSTDPEERASFRAVAGQASYVKVEPSVGGPKVSAIDEQHGSAEIVSCHQPD